MSKEEEATTQQFCLFIGHNVRLELTGLLQLTITSLFQSLGGKFTLHNTCLCMQMVQYACKCVSMDMHM